MEALANRSSRPLSAWGLLLRRARDLHGVTIVELALRLGVTKSYLGQSEFSGGTTKILPRKWWDKLIEVLPSLTREQLERAAAEETGQIIIPTSELTHDQQEATVFFAAHLPHLSRENCFRIREFLSTQGGVKRGTQAIAG